MPELPEVETVRRGLEPVMSGIQIARAEQRRPDLRWPFPNDMEARLTGAKITQLRRRSKYILADLDTGETLLIHLGMSGRMLISAPEGTQNKLGQFHHDHPPIGKHDHVILEMETGARITFNDPRRFGAMDLMVTADQSDHWLLSKLGPEPLGNSFNGDYLADRLKGRKTPIKTALLDQRIVSGLGNIYVCEALFRAGISPLRQSGRISARAVGDLVPIIREILEEAIQSGGSSLKDFRQTDGELGYFQHNFRVYGREDEICVTPECETKIHRITQSGRSSFYCPKCQR